ncbi:ABC transporter related protein [Pyrobaculum islandicum DSM 4184]|uniref:ABC transporter related protein n=1 Tax=Pyrobaculum islandicum (strain DSM 4184 / JCM 9189 / GEO3) TaxID=384616 RepID=A1RQY2_PYRIL|nr:ATP-binding cassette domain-containing protein [Pyrobaculum islandicum]ABL87364.1 ABC transporter related protein [Pyrobaculum islandicum DSM 4184]
MIEIRGVKVRAGTFEVLADGAEVVGKAVLLGPNGSGKTTLLRAVSGVIPYEGSIKIDGVEVDSARGLLTVSSNLPEIYRIAYDVAGLLEVFEDLKGVDRGEFEALMGRLGLGREVMRRPVHALSAGQWSLVRLALALSSRPKTILVDEPFENVDPARRGAVLKLLVERGESGIVATHDLDALKAMRGWDAYFMLEGRLYGPVLVDDLLASGLVRGRAGGALLTLKVGGVEYSVVKGAGVKFSEMGTVNKIYGLVE